MYVVGGICFYCKQDTGNSIYMTQGGCGLATGRSPVQVPERPSATEVALSKAPFPTLLLGRPK